MTDTIRLTGIRAKGFHGVFDFEKSQGQEFVIDVALTLDLAAAGRSDDLADTVNYAELADAIIARITGPSCDLIERLATVIAEDALRDNRIEAVEVTVHKPQAPIQHDFGDVAVTVRRGGTPAVIALGGNLGDRVQTLTSAVRELCARPGVYLTGLSPLVETDPIGPEQPDYLNAVATIRTTLSARELLAALHEIEYANGRTREIRWGARTLDLDLIQYGLPGQGSELLSTADELLVPHPRAAERAFVLVPWLAADPHARLRSQASWDAPVVTVASRLDQIGSDGVRPGPDWPRQADVARQTGWSTPPDRPAQGPAR